MNRGIARRTVFETDLDIRHFLSRVAREVRKDRIELHAYCVLSTHFHLLVRSPRGELPAAMQSITNEYVRGFNRRRRRDGSLFRGRYCSRPVLSLRYRVLLVRYIDDNSVDAGLASRASEYPHGSARHHAAARGPRWITRDWIEEHLRRCTIADHPPRSYDEVFGRRPSPGQRWLVERRLDCCAGPDDPLDNLVEASPTRVREWMCRKAALADGTRAGIPLVDPMGVEACLAIEAQVRGPWTIELGRNLNDAWLLARIGLLRDLCGTTLEETALRCGRSHQYIAKLHGRHRQMLQQDAAYADRLAHLAAALLSE
ncbi:MAG TPA: transposase [Planctomycetota bacterium]|nr:transposase [Planctomycetota bacterium]